MANHSRVNPAYEAKRGGRATDFREDRHSADRPWIIADLPAITAMLELGNMGKICSAITSDELSSYRVQILQLSEEFRAIEPGKAWPKP